MTGTKAKARAMSSSRKKQGGKEPWADMVDEARERDVSIVVVLVEQAKADCWKHLRTLLQATRGQTLPEVPPGGWEAWAEQDFERIAQVAEKLTNAASAATLLPADEA